MKSSLLAFTSVLSLATSGAYAADAIIEPVAEISTPYFGELEAAIGYAWLGGSGLEDDEAREFLFGAGALRLGMNFGSGLMAQGDLIGEVTNASKYDDSYVSGIAAVGHLAWRDPSRGLVGVFGGIGQTDQDDDETDKTDLYLAGLEGQIFLDNWTLYGQAGYLDSDGTDDDALYDAIFGRLVARYYVQPNTKIEAGLAAAFGKMEDNDDAKIVNWSLGLEHRYASTPLSLFVGYDGFSAEQPDEDDRITSHEFKIGLRYAFGAGSESLISKDRNGASLDAPAFLKWSGLTGGPLE